MTPSHKLFIIKTQNRVIAVQEIRVEDDFNSVGTAVEQLHAADLVENGISRVLDHVVRDDGRERIALERKDAALEQDLILRVEQYLQVGSLVGRFAVVAGGVLEEAVADAVLDLGDGLAELLDHGLALQRFDGVRVGSGGHDDESDDGDVGPEFLEAVVQTSQGFDEHVDSLVAVLVSASSEHLRVKK